MENVLEGAGIRPPELGTIPRELRSFRFDLLHLYEYFGNHSFPEALSRHHILRVLEVGTGRDVRAMEDLARLGYFQPNNLITADPRYGEEFDYGNIGGRRLNAATPDPLPKGYTLLPVSVGSIRDQIAEKQLAPFDVVMSKGLVSVGNLVPNDLSAHDILSYAIAEAKTLAGHMKECLNPHNPDALIMISAKHPGSMVPLPGAVIDSLGLTVVYALPTEAGGGAYGYMRHFRKAGFFLPDEVPQELMICKRK
mgnify:CR=1 FL=1